VVLGLGLLIGANGCNTVVTPDTTIGELLDQITVGDVVEAFQAFAAEASVGGPGGLHGASLTTDQRAQIEALQAQVSEGTISDEDFQSQVQAIIGDAGPGVAFVGFDFFGSPFGFGDRRFGAEPLDLTEEQREQARDIFTQLHDDIRTLRDAAHDRIRNEVLTEEQRATLDEMQMNRSGAGFGRVARFGGFGSMMGSGMGRHRGDRQFSERFAAALELTEEQQTQIETIRSELRAAIEARHQQARDEFRAILTPEQLAILDAGETDG